MKILITISCLFFAVCSIAQKHQLVANGSSSLYLTHKVASNETYAGIATEYNVSATSLANYNNLDYHPGKLLAKFLKVPLSDQNLIITQDRIVSNAFKPVYKQGRNGKLDLFGYLGNPRHFPKKTSDETDVGEVNKGSVGGAEKEKPFKDTISNASSPASVKDNGSAANKPAISKQPVTIKKTPFFKRKRNRIISPYGPARFVKEFLSTAITLSLLTFFLIGLIYFYASVKKRRFLLNKQLKTHIVKVVSAAIVNDEDDEDDLAVELPRLLTKELNQPAVRQFIIDEIIVAKRNLRGRASSNLNYLYNHLGLVNNSVEKLQSTKWYIKAKGIQELALMDEKRFLLQIFRQTNSENELVRMEAQSAIVHFAGFKGLRFLQVLTFPISNWQQIKLIEQLSFLSNAPEVPNGRRLLQSSNNSVIIFTLKIIGVFHQLGMHDDVVKCLEHPVTSVRYQAIKCLQCIYSAFTANILEHHYTNEDLKNRIAILEAMKEIGSADEVDFLYIELFDEEDSIKLAAAEALMECSPDGFKLIKDVSNIKGTPYTQILNHVKEGILV